MKRLNRRNRERLNNVVAGFKYHTQREVVREAKRVARSQARHHLRRLLGF